MQTVKRLYINSFRFYRKVTFDLKGCTTVLDVGCGKAGWAKEALPRHLRYYVGIDAFRPYLIEIRKSYPGRQTLCDCVLSDASSLPFTQKSFDAVVSFELLEHIEKNTGLRLLEELERIASLKVIIIVPNGPLRQEAYDENPLQVHRSSWSSNELENLGYRVMGIYGLRHLRGEKGLVRFHPRFVGELFSDLTQPWVERNPHYASHLYALKATDNPGFRKL